MVLMLYFFKQKYGDIDHLTIIATIFFIILLLIASAIGMLQSMVVIIIACYSAILFPESADDLIPEKYIEMSGWLGLFALLILFCSMGIYLHKF